MLERTTFIGVLALLLTLGLFAVVGALFFLPIPEENRDLLTTIIGVLSAGTSMAWGFYFKASAEPNSPVTPPEEG
jgi:hypothetical protein